MRKATWGPSDALPTRPSASSPDISEQNAEEDDDGDFEAGFNPTWMVPDRSGRFCWFKKKQTEGSLANTPLPRTGDRDSNYSHQQLQSGLADAANDTDTPPSVTKPTSFELPTNDRLAEGAWPEAKSDASDEFTPDKDIPSLERDDSFSRMLAHARLAGKRTRESPIPETTVLPSPPPVPSSYPHQQEPHHPLPRGPNDARRETVSLGQQSSVPQPRPMPLSPAFRTPGDKQWQSQSTMALEAFRAPEIRGQTASEMLSPMLDAVVPTAPAPPPFAELPRSEGRRPPARDAPRRVWSASMIQTRPNENEWDTDRPASEGSSPAARFCTLRHARQETPVDKWAMLDAAVPKMSLPSGGRAFPGRQWGEARDGVDRASIAPTSRRKLDEKRVWETLVSEEPSPTTRTLPPQLSLPLPHIMPLVPTARRRTPTQLGRNGSLGYEFPPANPGEERLITPPSPLQATSSLYGHPQSKRARDDPGLTSSPRPSSPQPCQEQDLLSAGWSQERMSTGALVWYNRFTGQVSHQKPDYRQRCQ